MLTSDLVYQSFRHPPADIRARTVRSQPLSIKASANGYDLMIYDIIGCGCCEASDVVEALATAGGAPLTVRINSPGGDAFEGVAVMNALDAYEGAVTAQIDGVAASAASYIAMAADTVTMMPNSFLMIHNAWTVSMGDKNRLQAQINALSRIDAMQVDVFSEKTGLGKADIAEMLDAETWMTADEALEFGFCDTVIDPKAKPADEETVDDVLNAMIHELDKISSFTFEKRRRVLAARLLSARYK